MDLEHNIGMWCNNFENAESVKDESSTLKVGCKNQEVQAKKLTSLGKPSDSNSVVFLTLFKRPLGFLSLFNEFFARFHIALFVIDIQ